jgi:hypothetical protein
MVKQTNKRIDTGWDCCICDEVGRVTGEGFTWCKRHWEEFDLGRAIETNDFGQTWSKTISTMRDRYITNEKYEKE